MKKTSRLKKIFSLLGPGLVTGAADDDPSGIATYSIAGSAFGISLLWMTWITWPLMAGVQMMCARIGVMTGKGLIGVFKQKFPKPLLLIISFALLIANIINIGADLNGMSDAVEILTGINSPFFIVVFGLAIGFAIIKFNYHQIANVLKWMTLSLFTYIFTAFLVQPQWSVIFHQTFLPSLPKGEGVWAMVVAVLGTTISPYLFFWQASQEVEEQELQNIKTANQRIENAKVKLTNRAIDVGVGTFLSNIVMFFIILTTALTLNKAGITNISSSKEAAEALRPLAGDFSMILFTLGIIAVGLLAIPTLAVSAAYAFAETFNWKAGLNSKPKEAPAFYTVIILAIICAILLDFFKFNPIRALFWSAVINGVIAPFLLIGIFIVARDSKVMMGNISSRLSQIAVAITIILMLVSGVVMVV